MGEQVIVRTVDQYWDEFIIGGLKDNKPASDIRTAAVDAAFEELEGLIRFRLKTNGLANVPKTEENVRKVENTIKEVFRKWNSLCYRCSLYRETKDILHPDDFKLENLDRDASEEADYNEDDVGDDGLPITDEQ